MSVQMPCNFTGLTEQSATETNFGVIDFDWSNARSLWVEAQPMNCEEMLMEQAKLTRAARPDAKVCACCSRGCYTTALGGPRSSRWLRPRLKAWLLGLLRVGRGLM